MTISPIGSLPSVPVALPANPAAVVERVATVAETASTVASPALGATAAQEAQGADDLLYGESGLMIQSYGAIALISPAALLYANAALPASQSRSLVAPVAPVQPVARIQNERRVDVAA
jgi:hypothetical protein